ncbi:hypothetical protein, partial [Pseudomaricurvus sp.]|uniref:hypothetical protein n=1 Tax=Pseudomaricurvus sp. TaxID=2004510 RepID=UPI003F6A7B39
MAAKYRRMLGGLLLLTLGVSLGIGGWLLWKAEAPSEKTAKASLTTVREIRGARERPSKPVITKLPLENPRPGVIRVGAVSQFSPPYNCDDNYRDYCIIPEVLERVFTQRGYQAEYQSVSLPREFIELATGRLDAAMVYTNTFLSLDDYPDTVHVCPVPAFHAPISAFARRDRPVELNSAEDMLKHHLVAIRLPGFLRG